jgi:hypothetical protein
LANSQWRDFRFEQMLSKMKEPIDPNANMKSPRHQKYKRKQGFDAE